MPIPVVCVGNITVGGSKEFQNSQNYVTMALVQLLLKEIIIN